MNMKKSLIRSLALGMVLFTVPFAFSRSMQEIAEHAKSIYATRSYTRLQRYKMINALAKEMRRQKRHETYRDADYIRQFNELHAMVKHDLTRVDHGRLFVQEHKRFLTATGVIASAAIAAYFLWPERKEEEATPIQLTEVEKVEKEVTDIMLSMLKTKDRFSKTADDQGRDPLQVKYWKPIITAFRKIDKGKRNTVAINAWNTYMNTKVGGVIVRAPTQNPKQIDLKDVLASVEGVDDNFDK